MDYGIRVVEQAMSLLQVLAQNPGATTTEIAAQTGLTKTLVFRIFFTLEKCGFVVKDPRSRAYTLGHGPVFLAQQARHHIPLLRIADSFMDELAAISAETVCLVVRDGLNAAYLAVRNSPLPTHLFAQVGRRGPLHAGAGGKVLLAHAPADIYDAVRSSPLTAFTPITATDSGKLECLVAGIREKGFCESYGDLDHHSFGFGAPVFDTSGVAAALSIAGPLSRLTPAKTEDFKSLVVGYAHRISAALTGRAEPGIGLNPMNATPAAPRPSPAKPRKKKPAAGVEKR